MKFKIISDFPYQRGPLSLRLNSGNTHSLFSLSNVFYKAIDSVLAGLATRYQALHDIAGVFRFL